MTPEIDRRGFLALFGASIAAGLLDPQVAWATGKLEPPQRDLLTAVADVILPSGTTPGAVASDTPGFVERMILEALPGELSRVVRTGLESLDAACEARFGIGFARLPRAGQVQVVALLDTAAFTHPPAVETVEDKYIKAFYLILKQLIVAGHYTSRIGVDAQLDHTPVPGAFVPDVRLQPGFRVAYGDLGGVPYFPAVAAP